MNQEISARKIYFDVMRIIACALVIFNHLPAYSLYASTSGIKQMLYMSLTMISRINVPLFFMISGALLLKKDEDYLFVLKKRFTRIAIVLLLFNAIMVLISYFNCLASGVEFNYSISSFVRDVLDNKVYGTGSYWFLYGYAGMLLVLPMLQRVAKGITKQEVISLIAVHFVFFSLLPIINNILAQKQISPLTVTGAFGVPFAIEKAIFFPLIGYYIENNVDINKLSGKKNILLLIPVIVGIALSNYCTVHEARITGQYSQNYVQSFDYLIAIFAFVMIKYLIEVVAPRINQGRMGRFIVILSSTTFGIYLIDPCIRETGLWDSYSAWAAAFLPTIIVSLLWIPFSMLICAVIVYVLKKTAVGKYLL